METSVILTPDQRVRVFVSSTLEELADERAAVRRAVESLHLAPVMFELGARPHPPRSLYRSYLEQSHVFVGLYWQRYGWVAPGTEVSGIEDEYLLSEGKPRLVYVKRPAPATEERLAALLDRIRTEGDVSYRAFGTAAELEQLVADDLAILLSETFQWRGSLATDDEADPRLRLPTAPTRFVGRTDELTELRELLGRERLVTLTGPGGVGKTRLALHLASEMAPRFPDGAAFVGLSSLQGPEFVAATVAQVLGVREEGPEGPLEALKNRLSDRSMLLVLDNFEHVVEATPVVTELVEAAPGLRLVVTSREALRIRAEHEVPVAPLPGPDAVELFAARASAVRHGFAVDDRNRATVNEIVDALEGVPLAIELAAARVRLLPPEAILERLDRRLDFLAAGARDLPERQRALRTTLDWSYDLLEEGDKRVFARLGAFAGSFSLDAAQAVCDPAGQVDVLTALASLVDKSLLRAESSDDEPRFRMLHMVREYAREQLMASPELEATGQRHADFYRTLGLELRPALRGPEQARWVGRLGSGTGAGDVDNLRAALRWYIDRAHLDDTAHILWSMWLLAWVSGRLEECRRWARDALATPGSPSKDARARLLTVAGLFEMWKGEYVESMAALTESVAMGRDLGDDELLATSLLGLGLVSSFVEGMDAARAHVEEAHDLFRAEGDRWGQAASFSALTWFLVAEDDFGTAHVFEDALPVAEQLADEVNRAMIETNVAEYRLHMEQYDEAGDLLVASLQRYRTLRALYPASYTIDAAARLTRRLGESRLAAVLLGAADRIRETIGVPVEGSHRPRRNRLVAEVRAELGGTSFDRALSDGRTLQYEEGLDAAIRAVTSA